MQKGSSSGEGALGRGSLCTVCSTGWFFLFESSRKVGTGPLEGEGGTFQQLMSCIHTSKMTASLCDRKHAGMSPKVCQGTVAGEPE